MKINLLHPRSLLSALLSPVLYLSFLSTAQGRGARGQGVAFMQEREESRDGGIPI